MKTLMASTLALSLLTMPAQALDAEAASWAQSAINADGESCLQVTAMAALGMVDNGDFLVKAVCSDGEKWVIQADSNTYAVTRVVACVSLQAYAPQVEC